MRQEPDGDIRVIFQVHSAAIWNAGAGFGLPGVAARLLMGTTVNQSGIFTMGGHEGGVTAFGTMWKPHAICF